MAETNHGKGEQNMVTFRKSLGLLLIVVLSSFTGCKASDHDHSMESPTTRIKEVDGIGVVVDLQSAEDHMKMMEMMKTQMNHSSEATHYFSVTLKDTASNQFIKDASVEISVILPGGNISTGSAEFMDGGNMMHYTAGFKLPGKGKYTVQTLVKLGDKSINPEFVFDLD